MPCRVLVVPADLHNWPGHRQRRCFSEKELFPRVWNGDKNCKLAVNNRSPRECVSRLLTRLRRISV